MFFFRFGIKERSHPNSIEDSLDAKLTGTSLLPVLQQEPSVGMYVWSAPLSLCQERNQNLTVFRIFAGYDTAYGSHTFHQVDMYYPVRVLVTKDYQLLHNMEYKMPYEIASDIYQVIKR